MTMRRSDALRLLAPAHARILSLADRDLDDVEIARRLALDPTAVAPALQVARAKLAALEALDEQTDAPGGNG